MAKVKDIINANTDGVIEATELLRTLKDLEGAIIDGVPATSVLNLTEVLRYKGLAYTAPVTVDRPEAIIHNNVLYMACDENLCILDNGTWTTIAAPHDITRSCLVFYNDELHVLGGQSTNYYTKHYKLNSNNTWTSVSTLPIDTDLKYAVIYNNEIHLIDSSPVKLAHYKWDGSSWTSVSTLPSGIDIDYGAGVTVYDNEIHVIGATEHYKWDGSSWIHVATLPIEFGGSASCAGAVVHKDKIFVFGTEGDANALYVWDRNSWTFLCELGKENDTLGTYSISSMAYETCMATEKYMYFTQGEQIHKYDYYYDEVQTEFLL